MSIRDIALGTAKQRQYTVKHVPSRIWDAMIWGNGVYTQQKWDKRQIIEQAYQRNPAFYAAVNILAHTVADIPVYVEYDVNGKTHIGTRHPVLSLMERDSSRYEFIEYFCKYFLVTGESYAQIVKSSFEGRPIGLIVVPSQYMDNIEGDYRKPIRGYRYMENREVLFTEEEIIHVFSPSLSRYFEPMSSAVPLAEYIDLNNAATTWNKNIAVGGGVPPLVAKMEGGSKEDAQALRDSWQAQSGANNSHRLKVISENLTLEKMNMTPHDAEWEQAILQSMRVIFMTLGVSSSLMNDAGNKTYNNVHDSRKALYQEGAIPIANKIYGALNRKLSHLYKDNPRIVLDTDNIDAIQEDKARQAERLVKLKQAGIITPNEARNELRYTLAVEEIANMLQDSAITNNIPKVDRPQDAPQEQTPTEQ